MSHRNFFLRVVFLQSWGDYPKSDLHCNVWKTGKVLKWIKEFINNPPDKFVWFSIVYYLGNLSSLCWKVVCGGSWCWISDSRRGAMTPWVGGLSGVGGAVVGRRKWCVMVWPFHSETQRGTTGDQMWRRGSFLSSTSGNYDMWSLVGWNLFLQGHWSRVGD